MGKYIWAWGVDGSILYVYEVLPPTRWRPSHKLGRVKYFYTSNFTDVQAVAEDFIKRLDKKS